MVMSSALNFGLALVVALPSLVFYTLFLRQCGDEDAQSGAWGRVCDWGRKHPWYLLNVLFFFNVDLFFWIVGILQNKFWLIDLYWTIVPVLIVHYLGTHPSSVAGHLRSNVVTFLIWFWSGRLTYSYLRREEWQWGAREDWRYAVYRKELGKHWWWMSFFMVFVFQHMLLVGLTLPLYAIHQNQLPWNVWDGLATVLCVVGIFVAHVADTQLYYFVFKNKVLMDLGAPKVPLLENGLWYYSRHPNYFGEQLFWWGLSVFAWSIGRGWAAIGTLVNSAVLAYVTLLVERKMLEDDSRAEVYREYQRSTSVLVPWFKWNSARRATGKAKSF